MGGDGVLVATADGVREQVAPYPVEVVCGLGRRRRLRRRALPRTAVRLGHRALVRAGNAAGAIVAARLMCADDMPFQEDLDAVLG